MRQAPDEATLADAGTGRMWQIWRSGDHMGATKPMRRVTVQKGKLFHQHTNTGRWGNLYFNQGVNGEVELPNVKSVEWQRSVDQDAATCTISLYNIAPLPLGQAPTQGDFDTPGWYTFNRGGQGRWNRWHYPKNEWFDVLVENRIIYTYEGYGFDAAVEPRADTNLACTGVWLIDKVILRSDKTIQLKCRDAAKILIKEICFPPVIPLKRYPLQWISKHRVANPRQKAQVTSNAKRGVARGVWEDDSNTTWVGQGNPIYGHRGKDAFDGNLHSYWLSIGNDNPGEPFAFEWVQAKVPGTKVSGVKFTPWKGNYVVYVSVMVNGVWLGSNVIPYSEAGIGHNGADIPYVKKTTCGWEQQQTILLGQTYKGVQRVRLTFTHLVNSGLGVNPYRAGCREFEVIQVDSGSGEYWETQTFHTEGNYSDYSEIVAFLCAIGGFFWPSTSGATTFHQDVTFDPVYGSPLAFHPDTRYRLDTSRIVGRPNRIFGDFEPSGTAGPVPLDVSTFDKKPLMDGIQYVKDILGFIFFVDEDGRAIFRSPNVWDVGNVIYPRLLPTPVRSSSPERTDFVPDIDERVQLTDLTVTLDDEDQREKVYVSNVDGRTAAAANGRQAHPMGIESVAIWTDQHFRTKKECRVMADLIALQYVFAYRTDSVTVPGNPFIQCDDQVRVWDRTTGEVYIHYIRGITSKNDAASTDGWVQTYDTHWLGDRPDDIWAFDSKSFSEDTRIFLKAQGKLPPT